MIAIIGKPDDVWNAPEKLRIAMLVTDDDHHLVSRPTASAVIPNNPEL